MYIRCMKKIVFTEEIFREYVQKGSVIVDDEEIVYNFTDCKVLTSGKILQYKDCHIILKDIGYDKIYDILHNN